MSREKRIPLGVRNFVRRVQPRIPQLHPVQQVHRRCCHERKEQSLPRALFAVNPSDIGEAHDSAGDVQTCPQGKVRQCTGGSEDELQSRAA